jgi:hypothetical protein
MNIVIQTFQSNLLKALCEDENKSINKCLISNTDLEPNYIKLLCNHEFNYEPILKEIIRQKNKKNRLETHRLKKYQIKCPYCRRIHKGILPYNPNFGEKINGVNWPPKYAFITSRCKAILKSGKRKKSECAKKCFGDFCKMHLKTSKTKEKCTAILKSGKRKGLQCYSSVKNNNSQKLCGKHLPKKLNK